jgi:hypothetical protein
MLHQGSSKRSSRLHSQKIIGNRNQPNNAVHEGETTFSPQSTRLTAQSFYLLSEIDDWYAARIQ